MANVESAQIKQRAIELGFDSCGICNADAPESMRQFEAWIGKGYHGTMEYLPRSLPMRANPQSLLPGVRSIIAVSLNYHQPNPIRAGYPRIAQYALGRDYHKVLRAKLRKLSAWLVSQGSEIATRICVDSAPILEREYAQRAGLGWYGKNTCLIDSKRGSFFFIGLVLTTALLEFDEPAIGGCGTCRACIDACPTGAIVFEDSRWQVDARRCISYLTIEHRGGIEQVLSEQMGDWTFGCDVCQDVCPFNHARTSQALRGKVTNVPDFHEVRTWPKLSELRVIDQPVWDAVTRGSPIRRAGHEGIKRNAEINLANSSRK